MPAQHQAAATLKANMSRINATYDTELARLRRLWAGTPPGSSTVEFELVPEGQASRGPRPFLSEGPAWP